MITATADAANQDFLAPTRLGLVDETVAAARQVLITATTDNQDLVSATTVGASSQGLISATAAVVARHILIAAAAAR